MAKDPIGFGEELRRLREAAGLTQSELALRITKAGHGVSHSAVGQWEMGSWLPTPERLEALEQILQPPSTLAALAGRFGPSPVDHERRLRSVERRLEEIERERG